MTTTVENSHGNLNTGPGPQVIVQVMRDISGVSADPSGDRPRGQWLEEQFLWLRARYSPPPGSVDIQAVLATKHVVLLRGEPGSGRRTAAMMLLSRSLTASGSFTELLPNFDNSELTPFETDVSMEKGDRVLFDMSTVGKATFEKSVPLLHPLFGAVKKAGAFLVVVLPDDYETHGDLAGLTVDHQRPDAVHALARHLRNAGFSGPEIHQDQRANDYVRDAPLRRVHELSDLMARIRDAERTTGYAECVTRALAIMNDGHAGARALVADHKGSDRVLLLSIAMLAGGSSDAVWRIAEIFRRSVGYPADQDHDLDREDFLEQLTRVGATVDGKRSIRFKDPVEASLRDYFWDAYPRLREKLAPWVQEALAAREVSRHEADLLVGRLAELLFRAEHVDLIDRLIQKWARSENQEVIRQARALLERGLTHEVYAARFRNRLWQWSQTVTAPGLGAVLIGSCTLVLAQTHPEQALTRLRHLARRPAEIGSTAREALAVLVRPSDRLLRRLLDKIAESGYLTDAATFVAVVDPGQLTATGNRRRSLAAEPTVRAQLVEAWRAVFARRPEGWTEHLGPWLETEAFRGPALLAVLGEATGSSTDSANGPEDPNGGNARSLLFAAALDWADGRPDRLPTVETLLDHINAAQGISFAAATTERTR